MICLGRGGHTVRKGRSWVANPGISVSQPALCYTNALGTKVCVVCVCPRVHTCVRAAGVVSRLVRTPRGSHKVRCGGTRQGGGTRQKDWSTKAMPPCPLPPDNVQVGQPGWEAAQPAVLVGERGSAGIPHSSPLQPTWAPPLWHLDLQGWRGGDIRCIPPALVSHLACMGPFPCCKMGLSLLPRPFPGRRR